jgi:two-component system, cell cycle sensor histidine kinase and response regulator CckA
VNGSDFHEIARAGDLLSEVLYSQGPDGSVRQLSRSFERLTGMPAAAVQDNAGMWLELVHAEDRERLDDERRRRLAEGTPGEVQYRVRHRIHGAEVVLLDHAIPVQDDDGAVVRVDGVLVDLTLRAARDEDWARQRRLEAMGRMTTSVAHSYNNLLTVITGYASALEDVSGLDPLEQRAVAQITTAADRASDLSRRLVTLARGDVPPRARTIAVVRLLAEARDMLRGMLSRAIELRVAAQPDLPPIQGDPTRLIEALLHLAANARDAMPQGGTITLAAYLDEHDERRLLIEISDTGSGMTEDVLARVFDPFFTTRERDDMAGLGCALAREIAQDHGGTIAVDSTPGKGTRVRLRLPVRTAGVGRRGLT